MVVSGHPFVKMQIRGGGGGRTQTTNYLGNMSEKMVLFWAKMILKSGTENWKEKGNN